MENILITGADGQLGSELRKLTQGREDLHCLYTDLGELDITDADAVERYISDNAVTKIINCAAYNDVDRAETDSDAAIRLNVYGPMNLAEPPHVTASIWSTSPPISYLTAQRQARTTKATVRRLSRNTDAPSWPARSR